MEGNGRVAPEWPGHAPGDWGLEHFLLSSLGDALKVALTDDMQ